MSLYDEEAPESLAVVRLTSDAVLGLPDPNYFTDQHIRESLELLDGLENPDRALLRSALSVYRSSTTNKKLQSKLDDLLNEISDTRT